jgi:D-alanyl-D-alanine carboxypeptidase
MAVLAAGPASPDTPDTLRAIDARLAELATSGVLGSIVSIRVPGETALTVAHGFADIAHETPLTTGHLFQVGSQSKMFTAAAILRLERSGALRLDDLVSKYVEGTPQPKALTIRHLLQHTGGIGDGIRYFDPPLGRRPDFPVTFDEHLFLGKVAGEEFEPGASWNYNNLGYVILGRVIESASGQPLEQYIRVELLRPLGMNETWLGDREPFPEARMARGYYVDERTGQRLDATMLDLSWASSAGDMVSCLADLERWAQALLEDDNAIGLRLGDFTADPVRLDATGNMKQYGTGMMQRDLDGRTFWGHGGFIQGYVTLTLVEPSSGTTVLLLTNLADASEGVTATLEQAVIDILALVPPASGRQAP